MERLDRRHEDNKKEEEMKITKRQLRRIIKEAIQGIAAGPNAGKRFVDLALEAMAQKDYVYAANRIMDSFWIDDTYGSEEEALIQMLTSAGPSVSEEDLHAISDEWFAQFKAGAWQ